MKTHDTDIVACVCKYTHKHTLSSCLELRRELMRESSDATRWRSASSSRQVREMRDDAVSCNSFACSTSLETSPPTGNDSPGESPIGLCWPSDQQMRYFRFNRWTDRDCLNIFGFFLFLVSNYVCYIGMDASWTINLGFFYGNWEIGWIGIIIRWGQLFWRRDAVNLYFRLKI